MIWHTSDWHLGHKNIITYDGRPDKSIEEMNARIIEATNRCVGPDDLLINHGDIAMPRLPDRDDNDAYVKYIADHLAQLHCKNILQVGGNHDKVYVKEHGDWVPNWALWDLFAWQKQCQKCRRIVNKNKVKRLVDGCPFCKAGGDGNFWYNSIEGMHPMGLELKLTRKMIHEHKLPEWAEGVMVVCAHYSHRVWNKSHRDLPGKQIGRSIMLYGHSHGGLPGMKNSFDVGFNIHNRPLSLADILSSMMPTHNTTEIGQVTFDHHPGDEDK